MCISRNLFDKKKKSLSVVTVIVQLCLHGQKIHRLKASKKISKIGFRLTYQFCRFVLTLIYKVLKTFLHSIYKLLVLPKAYFNDVVNFIFKICIQKSVSIK